MSNETQVGQSSLAVRNGEAVNPEYQKAAREEVTRALKASTAAMIEHAARAAHTINRIYCESIGDSSQVPWDEAPEHIKKSVRDGVQFLIDNPHAAPSASHDNWLKFKQDEGGWRYGPVKDLDAKVHPCFVPYDELPIEQRRKDALFTTVVKAIIRGPF